MTPERDGDHLATRDREPRPLDAPRAEAARLSALLEEWIVEARVACTHGG